VTQEKAYGLVSHAELLIPNSERREIMRLRNKMKFGGFEWIVMLDDKIQSTNFIERTKGVHYDEINDVYRCLKCMKPLAWLHWESESYAKDVCVCGQTQTLQILSFDDVAKISETPFDL